LLLKRKNLHSQKESSLCGKEAGWKKGREEFAHHTGERGREGYFSSTKLEGTPQQKGPACPRKKKKKKGAPGTPTGKRKGKIRDQLFPPPGGGLGYGGGERKHEGEKRRLFSPGDLKHGGGKRF